MNKRAVKKVGMFLLWTALAVVWVTGFLAYGFSGGPPR